MVEITGMRGIPFDATQILNESGEYVYDNVYYSEDFAEWFRNYFGNGILIPSGTTLDSQLEVVKSSSAKVSITAGAIVVAGRNGILYNPYTLDVSIASSGSKRIDRVVVEMNEQANRFNLKIVEGIESTTTPNKPSLTREIVTVGADEYEIYQMSLASVLIDENGIVSIEDERSDSEVCGISIVIPGVGKPKLPTGDSAENISFNPVNAGTESDTVQKALDELYEIAKGFVSQRDFDLLSDTVAGKAETATYSGTLPITGWTDNTGYFTKAVTVTGILATDEPILDLVATTSGFEAEQGAWGKVFKAVTSAGTITFYASEIPATEVNFIAKVVR